MKKMIWTDLYKAVVFMAVVLIFSSSCKKDDPVLPDYVGTWTTVVSYPTDNGNVSVRENMTFTETTFVDLAQMQMAGGQWTDFMKMKGSMSVSGNLMNVTLTEVGISTFSMISGLPTGQITSYQTGSADFDDLLAKTGQSKTFKSAYSVSGNQLTLKTDNNEDGDYLDDNETTVYTRQ